MSKSIRFTAEFNIVPMEVSAVKITAFESRQPEWLDENYYHIHTIMPAICCRMVDKGINPHHYIGNLNSLQDVICKLREGQTARYNVGGLTVVVYHMDKKRGPTYELVAY